MHIMVTILPIPILRITIVRESQLSAGFAGKSRNRGSLIRSSAADEKGKRMERVRKEVGQPALE